MEWWHKVEGWGREHPVLLGFAVFIIGAVLLYALWPSSAPQQQAAAQPDLAGLAASGNALQAAALQAQAQGHLADNALTASLAQTAGQLELGKIASATSLGIAGISADVAGQEIAAGRDVALQSSTLTAQTAQAGYDRDTRIATLQYGAATDQARINADAFTTGKTIDAGVANSSFQAQLQRDVIGQNTSIALANLDIVKQNLAQYGNTSQAFRTVTATGGMVDVAAQGPAQWSIGGPRLFELLSDPGPQGQVARQSFGVG